MLKSWVHTNGSWLGRRAFARIALVGALFGATLYAFWFHLTVEVWPFDDAFITYRYVENLLAGRGLIYNPGELVFGSSSPLYVAWLGLLGALARTESIPILALRGNAIWSAVTTIGMAATVYRLSGSLRWGLLATAVAALCLPLLAISAGGMESSMFCALLVWSLLACLTERYVLAASLAGLGVVARPEGLLLAGLLALHWLCYERKRAVLLVTLLIAPAIVWAGFATWYFGSPIPQSLVVKSLPLYPLPAGNALLRLLSMLASVSVPALADAHATLEIVPVNVALGAVLTVFGVVVGLRPALAWVAGLGARSAARERSNLRARTWLVPATFLSLVLFYTLGNPLMLEWYGPPIYVSWFLVLLVTSSLLPDGEGGGVHMSPGLLARRLIKALSNVLLLALFGSLAFQYVGPALAGKGPLDVVKVPSRLRIAGYKQAGEWLTLHAGRDAIVAAPEIGALGYFWAGKVLDACGLVSRVALAYLPVPAAERVDPSVGAISTRLVQAERPDFVVTMPVFVERSLLVNLWFAENYRLEARFPLPAPLWRSNEVLVFQRQDLFLQKQDQ